MGANNNGFKRRFPKMGKCICCCCCNPEESVKTGTIILLILTALGLVLEFGLFPSYKQSYDSMYYSINNYVGIAFSIILVISLFLLYLGIKKVNNLYLNQFKIVFLVYLVYEIISFFIALKIYYSEDYIETQVQILKEQNEQFQEYFNGYTYVQDEDKLRQQVKQTTASTIFSLIITFGVMVYYYLTTCSFIEDLQEEAYEEDDIRVLESNNKNSN